MPELKVLNGRVATAEDVNAGTVVFYIPDSRSTLYRFDRELPLPAKLLSDTIDGLRAGSEITIVQGGTDG
ncbi:MAG TPA: hypothetical protein VKV02_03990 [Acidobacteriaceae bacterium]|nr:hypothetical protein [Acidobacteriaceae bacterium]